MVFHKTTFEGKWVIGIYCSLVEKTLGKFFFLTEKENFSFIYIKAQSYWKEKLKT